MQWIPPAELAVRLAELPPGLTRISVALPRGVPVRDPEREPSFYAHITELGSFSTSGPCGLTEITRRFGNGDYRVTAYRLEPPTLQWEVSVKGVRATK